MNINRALFMMLTLAASFGATAWAGICDIDGMATMEPTTSSGLKSGTLHTATMTYTAGAGGLTVGDKIALRIPDFWPYPYIATPGDGNIYSGHSTFTYSGSASLSASISSQSVVIAVDSGSVSNGEVIKIYYAFQTCATFSSSIFRMLEYKAACGTVNEIGSKSYTLGSGNGTYVRFSNYEYLSVVGQVTPLSIRVTDWCGNSAASTSPIPIALSLLNADFTTDSTSLLLSASSNPFTAVNSFSQPITSGNTVYYRVTSGGTAGKRVQLNYTPPGTNYIYQENAGITHVNSGISAVSVDSGASTFPPLSSTTFTPDQDGVNDFAFINFTLPVDTGWQVRISSNANFSTTVRQFYGWGRFNRISWDGNTDWRPDAQPGIADPGTYHVRIEVNGLPVNNALSIVLQTAGLSGTVMAGTAPVANAAVDVFGPAGRSVRTKGDGKFTVFGLRAGPYSYRISKEGFETVETSTTVAAGQLLQIGQVQLGQAAVARLVVYRSTDSLNEIWGSVNAHTSDGQHSAWGSIHFGVSKATSDAGDLWNTAQTSYTALSLRPAKVYNLRFEIPNLGVGTIQVGPYAAGQIIDISTTATRRANITGTVCAPASFTQTSHLWLSIEAGIDVNKDGTYDSTDPSKRFYAGGSIPQGNNCGSFSINGVTNGTYTLQTRAPFLAPTITTNVVVSGGQDAFVAVSTLTTGSSIGGTVTVIGDTTGNPNVNGGNIRVPISVWSPTTYIGSYQDVSIPVSGGTTSYALTGLSNGVYNLWTSLPGFELDPPGQRNVVVSAGSTTLNLTFKKFGGSLSGTIAIPGGGNYSDVRIELLPYDSWAMQPTTSTPSGSSYSLSGLGTGHYTLRALYQPTGFIFERNVQIINGIPSTVNIVLTGATRSISGKVVTQARSPYATLEYLVAQTTPTTLYNTLAATSQSFPANRIVARRLLVRDDSSNNSGGTSAAVNNRHDPWVTFYGTYNTNGEYTIPNLTPGVYLLSNNGEMDNDIPNGKEIAEIATVVSITNADLTEQNFNLTDGYDVSGRLTVDSGTDETGRNVRVMLKNNKGDALVSQLVYLVGTTLTFSLNRVPPGRYVLTAEDQEHPKKYAAKDVSVEVVAASLANQEIKLLSSAKIQGQLRIKTSGELITSQNYSQLLPQGFSIEARSNPWFQGGWGRTEGTLIGADNTFTLTVSPGTYDVIFRSEQLDQSQAAQGKKSFVRMTKSGVRVTAGQTTNLGIVELSEGVPVSGAVTDANGNPLPNIRVIADSGASNWDSQIEAFTNHLGSYSLLGLDPEVVRFYDIVAAPRPDSDDTRFSNTSLTAAYGESRRARFDTRQIPMPPVNFRLSLALGSVSGSVTIPAGSSQPLLLPFDEGTGVNLPGAFVIMNKQGDIPQKNPLGDIEQQTNPDGTFTVKGLAAGVYDMWILALNYGSVSKRNIVVGSTNVDVGLSTVTAGFKMSGTLAKTDGSPLNSSEFDTVVGIQDGFGEIVIGRNTEDAAGNITGYSMSGFQVGRSYSILLFGENDDVVTLAESMVLSGDTVQDFVVGEVNPSILTQASKNPDGSMNIQFELTKALRNLDINTDDDEIADDSQRDKIIKLKTGAGTLSHNESNWLASDRKRILVTYTPAPGETSFVLTASCTFVSIDGTTGKNQSKVQDFTYYVGIGKQRTVRISNAGGGTAQLDEDVSKFQSQPGTFGNNSKLEVNVQFRSADPGSTFSSQKLLGASAVAQAAQLGQKAYPMGMSAAMQNIRARNVEDLVFGNFYDIFLPLGVSHFFPQGKEAQLCLRYDDGAPDPHALNIYYFNEQSSEYLLESQNKLVDTDNQRICVNISHASIFTVLASSDSVIAGGGYNGELAVMNFPNPFDLKQKTVTLQDPGSVSASQTILGTMIKVSVPSTMGGSLEIQIFNVAGEKVRTINTSLTSGAHNYVHWDGANEKGERVASGAYIGRLTVGGSNEKFFKMAVIK